MIRERRPKQINPAVVATGYIRAEPRRSYPRIHSSEQKKENQKEKNHDGGGSGTLRPCPESYKVAGSNPAPASADTQEYEEAETCGCEGKGLRNTSVEARPRSCGTVIPVIGTQELSPQSRKREDSSARLTRGGILLQ